MSIKKKKPINRSKNSYRLRKIERYLIAQGYVQVPDDRCIRWVDCVSNGRDICYRVEDIFSLDLDRQLQQLGGYNKPGGKDGYFSIDAPSEKMYDIQAYTIVDAVKRSRALVLWRS